MMRTIFGVALLRVLVDSPESILLTEKFLSIILRHFLFSLSSRLFSCHLLLLTFFIIFSTTS